AAFDGGTVSSDGGALLLKRTDEAIDLIDRLARCFRDARNPQAIEHSVRTLIGQRVFGMALGYEDLNDHESLRYDPVRGALIGKLEAKRKDCAPLAGKSTLNRLELHPLAGVSRYHKIRPDPEAIERLFVELFLDAHASAPDEIVLDLDATDDPLHGHQEGRFFHGYYDGYCYLPLYIFCGEHLLVAKLRRSNIDGAAGAREEVERIVGQIRARWPDTRIILRADSGFAREELMHWCEQHAVDYVFGLARNSRLERAIGAELNAAAAESAQTGRPARRFKDLVYRTRKSWSRPRRVVGKAEQTGDKANPRFVVTSLSDPSPEALYRDLYCARGQDENFIKAVKNDLASDRTSDHTFLANHLRLFYACAAYSLIHSLRENTLCHTELARAQPMSIILKLFKLAVRVVQYKDRIKLHLPSACPVKGLLHRVSELLYLVHPPPLRS
ncbi:MAG: IS1380 family transposase, partial [Burkholderiales bacterium]